LAPASPPLFEQAKVTTKGDIMPTKKRTSTKPKATAPQAEQTGFETVDHALAEAEGFLTTKIVRFIRAIGTAAKQGDGALIVAGADLLCELRIADPEKWRRTTGRELPRNVEELRELMVECGFSPDFISAGEWTPREVGPVLMKKLRPDERNRGQVESTAKTRRQPSINAVACRHPSNDRDCRRGTEHDVRSEQALRWVKVLAEHPGEWISGPELEEHDSGPDQHSHGQTQAIPTA
jgi:hypothetical protein